MLKKIIVAGTERPRIGAGLGSRDYAQVFLVREASEPRDIFRKIDAAWDSHFSELFDQEQRVLIKINLNTSDPFPASTSPEMLAGLLDFLRSKGVSRLMVGDCSTISSIPTRKVARKSGILDAVSGKAQMVFFDEEPWVKVPVKGIYLKEVTIARAAFQVDRIIYLANMKTHRQSDFTFGLKLTVGFLHPLDRILLLHREHLREKIAELSLAVTPDLTIIDGRSAFVSGGPEQGRVEKAGVVIFGKSPLFVDVEAYRQLYYLKKKLGCLEHFKEDPFAMAQLGHGKKLELAGKTQQDYSRIELS